MSTYDDVAKLKSALANHRGFETVVPALDALLKAIGNASNALTSQQEAKFAELQKAALTLNAKYKKAAAQAGELIRAAGGVPKPVPDIPVFANGSAAGMDYGEIADPSDKTLGAQVRKDALWARFEPLWKTLLSPLGSTLNADTRNAAKTGFVDTYKSMTSAQKLEARLPEALEALGKLEALVVEAQYLQQWHADLEEKKDQIKRDAQVEKDRMASVTNAACENFAEQLDAIIVDFPTQYTDDDAVVVSAQKLLDQLRDAINTEERLRDELSKTVAEIRGELTNLRADTVARTGGDGTPLVQAADKFLAGFRKLPQVGQASADIQLDIETARTFKTRLEENAKQVFEVRINDATAAADTALSAHDEHGTPPPDPFLANYNDLMTRREGLKKLSPEQFNQQVDTFGVLVEKVSNDATKREKIADVARRRNELNVSIPKLDEDVARLGNATLKGLLSKIKVIAQSFETLADDDDTGLDDGVNKISSLVEAIKKEDAARNKAKQEFEELKGRYNDLVPKVQSKVGENNSSLETLLDQKFESWAQVVAGALTAEQLEALNREAKQLLDKTDRDATAAFETRRARFVDDMKAAVKSMTDFDLPLNKFFSHKNLTANIDIIAKCSPADFNKNKATIDGQIKDAKEDVKELTRRQQVQARKKVLEPVIKKILEDCSRLNIVGSTVDWLKERLAKIGTDFNNDDEVIGWTEGYLADLRPRIAATERVPADRDKVKTSSPDDIRAMKPDDQIRFVESMGAQVKNLKARIAKEKNATEKAKLEAELEVAHAYLGKLYKAVPLVEGFKTEDVKSRSKYLADIAQSKELQTYADPKTGQAAWKAAPVKDKVASLRGAVETQYQQIVTNKMGSEALPAPKIVVRGLTDRAKQESTGDPQGYFTSATNEIILWISMNPDDQPAKREAELKSKFAQKFAAEKPPSLEPQVYLGEGDPPDAKYHEDRNVIIYWIEPASGDKGPLANFGEALDTAIHETTHAFQHALVAQLDRGELTEGSAEHQQAQLFKLNFDAYMNGSDLDHETYKSEPVEEQAWLAGSAAKLMFRIDENIARIERLVVKAEANMAAEASPLRKRLDAVKATDSSKMGQRATDLGMIEADLTALLAKAKQADGQNRTEEATSL